MAGVKPAYHAFQHLTAVFDDRLARVPGTQVEADTERSLSVYGYRERDSGARVVTLWFDGEVPSDNREATPLTVTVLECAFQRPAYVDLFSGDIYAIPKETFSRGGDKVTFHSLPVYDSPILVAEQGLLNLAG